MNTAFLSLVIPNYNEEAALPFVIEEIKKTITKLAEFPELTGLEVIIVDDGSTDSSFQIINSAPWIRLVTHNKNMGYGAAIKSGIACAKGDIIAFLDMDATYHVSDILFFSRKLLAENLDMVVGDRQLCKQAMPPIRRLGNWFFSQLTSLVVRQKIKDCCSGLRVVRSNALRDLVHHLPNDFDFALVLTLKMAHLGHPFTELATLYKPRLGQSKLSEVNDGFRFLRRILAYRFL